MNYYFVLFKPMKLILLIVTLNIFLITIAHSEERVLRWHPDIGSPSIGLWDPQSTMEWSFKEGEKVTIVQPLVQIRPDGETAEDANMFSTVHTYWVYEGPDGKMYSKGSAAAGSVNYGPGKLILTGERSLHSDPALHYPIGEFLVEMIVEIESSTSSNEFPKQISNAVVIPTDANGDIDIILESSVDLVNWAPAVPGTYSTDVDNRFFRVRAETQ